MATYLKYREAYTGRMVHNTAAKNLLELKNSVTLILIKENTIKI